MRKILGAALLTTALSGCALIDSYLGPRNAPSNDVTMTTVEELLATPEKYEGRLAGVMGTATGASASLWRNGYMRFSFNVHSTNSAAKMPYEGLVDRLTAERMNRLLSYSGQRPLKFIYKVERAGQCEDIRLEKIVLPGEDIDVGSATLNNR